MFHTVLVANRGEIARRIIRTLRALGIRSVAVYSDADAGAPFVQEADVAVRIGPAAASESYLNIDAVIAAAVQTEAQAIHPGYGFLSENVAFAQACADAGIVFIGPSVDALQVMADKITAKAHVAAHGVPVVPGFSAAGLADDDIAARATEVGYPILVKPSAGGGGKGMQVVREPAELADALATARRVALAAFGDDTLLLERLVERPRHIEVQVLGDNAGTIIHLGERECTLQRRHQKVIEEAPSAVIDAETRARIGAAAVDAARSVSYRGAGTVEFLVASDNVSEFFFIEMNTRLQVEHPVTEMVTGIDLVHQQLRVAAGEELGLTQDDITLTGHAIEARVYAETPARGFLPATGQVLHYAEPANARVDSAIDWFSEVSSNYDPMLAKVIAHAPTRAQAIDKLIAALQETVILGVDTNLEFLTGLLDSEEVRTAHMDTGLLDRLGTPTLAPPHPELVQAAAYQQVSVPVVGNVVEVPMLSTPWGTLNGWRASGAHVAPTYTFATDDDERVSAYPAEIAAEFADDADGAIWVHYEGQTRRLRHLSRSAQVELMLASIEEAAHPASPEARAPMPGNVVAVHVATGDHVEIGDRLVTIEAMKMEHPILATVAGFVTVDVALGDHVARDQRVAHLTPKEDNV